MTVPGGHPSQDLTYLSTPASSFSLPGVDLLFFCRLTTSHPSIRLRLLPVTASHSMASFFLLFPPEPTVDQKAILGSVSLWDSPPAAVTILASVGFWLILQHPERLLRRQLEYLSWFQYCPAECLVLRTPSKGLYQMDVWVIIQKTGREGSHSPTKCLSSCYTSFPVLT